MACLGEGSEKIFGVENPPNVVELFRVHGIARELLFFDEGHDLLGEEDR